MTPFAPLMRLAGLSQSETAAYLDVPHDTLKSWSNGRRTAPPGVIEEMKALIRAQQQGADEMLDEIEDRGAKEVELGYPADDHEAQQLGMPTTSAWGAMAARVIAETDARVTLVPRGSTIGTAAAADEHDQ